MAEHGHEQVVFCFDRQTGMRAIIAIHDTALGPARGGTRYRAYASEEDALEDV
ncbi:MAG TPA: Glu/Leu/Phe/Val dehydrogenase dimerization domain-containing protein, partial [Actinomycetota bacterium]|nr:Glu/Leu/Phe/Val dehydrogenase dimerization domain-containing protein [Actinomycetota bacterium]